MQPLVDVSQWQVHALGANKQLGVREFATGVDSADAKATLKTELASMSSL